MAASPIDCIFTLSRATAKSKNRKIEKIRRSEDADRCIFIMHSSDASFRSNRAYAVAMAQGFYADGRQPESDERLEDRATARIVACLQGGRAQGAIIHCKNAVDLF